LQESGHHYPSPTQDSLLGRERVNGRDRQSARERTETTSSSEIV
jgi:hypothetical protein